MNAWILEKELKPTVATSLAGDARRLAHAVAPLFKEGSPVDSLILTPELKFIGIQSANDALSGQHFRKGGSGLPGYARLYREFLEDSMAKIAKGK